MKQIILLRGINVGGNNKIRMAELRSVLTSSGFENVETYIQSGNVSVDSEKKIPVKLISEIIEQEFKLQIPVVIQTKAQIDKAIKNIPYTNFEPKKLHVIYLDKKVPKKQIELIEIEKYLPDTFTIIDEHIFIHYQDNSWASKLTIKVFEKALGVTATARNWNTALKLQQMCAT